MLQLRCEAVERVLRRRWRQGFLAASRDMCEAFHEGIAAAVAIVMTEHRAPLGAARRSSSCRTSAYWDRREVDLPVESEPVSMSCSSDFGVVAASVHACALLIERRLSLMIVLRSR